MITRKDRIYQCVVDHTKELIATHTLNKTGIDALTISLKLKLDRANVSRELNSLWKVGKLIKLQGRPTLYIDYNTIHSEYPSYYIPLSISSNSSLLDFLQETVKETHKELPFHTTSLDNIIGSNGSLKEEINKAVAAISYPPHGLPILLTGNAGVGKRKFAESLYYYALENDIFQDKKFIHVNCHDYAYSEDRFASLLLGTKKDSSSQTRSTRGLLNSAKKDIIYFDGLHKLTSKSIDLIVNILKNKSYMKIGDNTLHPLETLFVASISQSAETNLRNRLEGTFPVIISLPDFNLRNSIEKIETILYFFTQEAFSTQRNIKFEKEILIAFSIPQYSKNEQHLRSEIQSACSKAFFDSYNKASHFITIHFEHLSDFVLSSALSPTDESKDLIQTLSLYKDNFFICEANGHCDALDYYKNFSSIEKQAATASENATLSILIACHGQGTASDLKYYTQALAAESGILTEAVNYTENLTLDNLLDCMSDAVTRINRGSGVLILADMDPITAMEAFLQKRTQIPCRILPSVTLSFLIKAITKCSNGASLEHFAPQASAIVKQSVKEYSQEEFITRLVNDILSRTLLYVNPKKATDTLLYSLNIILDNLQLNYSQEIAVKYLSHGVHMIERIIKNAPLPYYQLRQFTNANHQLMDVIAQSLTIVSDTFDISIPSSEIAYLSEIFLSAE